MKPPPFQAVQIATRVDTVPSIDAPDNFHIGDATALVKRAGSKAMSGRGRADQTLPDL